MEKYVVVSKKGEDFLKNGQRWMYRNNLLNQHDCFDGDIVKIISEDGHYVATGFFSAVSHIVVRIIDFQDKEINEEYFYQKLLKAYQYRKEKLGSQIDNCRLFYGEADGIPGLLLDRYNDILVSQISCKGVEIRQEMFYSLCKRIVRADGSFIKAIYQRNEIKAREKEGLPIYKGFYAGYLGSPKTIIKENGLSIMVDVMNGQKTGYFLDQKENRYWIQQHSLNLAVLDCFCHTGGFSLNAAKGLARRVTAVDVSLTALKQGEDNARLNGLENKIEFVQDDVFHYLNTIKKGEYDLIILDPPAFTKSRLTIDHAYNGYRELNQKAMEKLEDKGILVSCSCSRYMEEDMFRKMLIDAASLAKVTIEDLQVRYQSADHPIDNNIKESLYLKFFIMKIRRY